MRGMLMLKKLSLLLICTLLLQACNQLDDYFLGKDNTPIPENLPPSMSQISLVQAWKVNVGAKSGRMHEKLSPAVQGHQIYIAMPGGQVQDRDIRTGELYWQQNYKSGFTSGPAISEGVIALGSHHAGLMLLNQKNGQLLWKKKLSGELLAKPLIVSGKVIVKTVDGNLYAFETKTGRKIWHWQHGSPELILKASSSPIMIPPHLVLVGYADGKLDAIDINTGNLIWQKGLVYASGATDVDRLVDIDADPILYRNMLLLGSYQGLVGALSLDNGEFVWKKPASIYQNMSLGAGRLYIADDNGIIWSINPNNGQINWKQIHLKARGLTSPIWTPNGLVIADKTGMIHVLSTGDGGLIGRASVSGSISTNPVVYEHRVLILTEQGQLYAFDIQQKGRVG
jgi:outer membrane protein assembly factor BamB